MIDPYGSIRPAISPAEQRATAAETRAAAAEEINEHLAAAQATSAGSCTRAPTAWCCSTPSPAGRAAYCTSTLDRAVAAALRRVVRLRPGDLLLRLPAHADSERHHANLTRSTALIVLRALDGLSRPELPDQNWAVHEACKKGGAQDITG